ncbi:MAG: carbohydrate binding family 9 domain-containing protein [Ignavibacteria bacterium]|nr:carbohydrate binding family 9 domain-containing protein [Ignavibacteria bacterium]
MKNFSQKFKLIVVFFAFSVAISFSQSSEKVITAVKVNVPPEIDGNFQGGVWADIPGDSSFLQLDPVPGAEPAFKTVVKVVYTESDLYLLFICYDDDTGKLVAREMKYDGFTSGDDNVKLIIDTFGDRRNAYWLATNPLSVKNDALAAGKNFTDFNEDWNMIWDVKSRIYENYWCAEFRIPFASLKFPEKEEQVWGINFMRGIQRLNQDVIWSGAAANGSLFDMTRAGKLIGIKGVRRGNPTYVVPFVNAGLQDINSDKDSKFKLGLDVKYGISDAFTLDLTANTDFAQVEADVNEINLSRFPLFLPEKREFFLEGNKFFSFDLADGNSAYYSRTIGIDRGEGVPILGGFKLTGSTGKLELGILDVQTDGTSRKSSTNYLVSRAKYNVFGNSYAGVIFSNVQSKDGVNRLAGADVQLNFNDFLGDKNLVITTKYAGNFDNSGLSNKTAGLFSIDYPNDEISAEIGFGYTGENFNPATGFVFRNGLNQWSVYGSYSPRVNSEWFRRIGFTPINIDYFQRPGGEVVSYEYNFTPLSVTFSSNDMISLMYSREFDHPDYDFAIFKNTIIPAGEYYGNRFGAYLASNYARDIYGNGSISYGDFYGGKRFEAETEITTSLSKYFGVSLSYRYNGISINGSELHTNEVLSRIKYTMSVDMATFLLVQWNNEINQLNFNFKINYKPSPGSDIYLVVNKLFDTESGLVSRDLVIILKIAWMFII